MTLASTPQHAAVRSFDCGCQYSMPEGWSRCADHDIVKGQRFTCRRLHKVGS